MGSSIVSNTESEMVTIHPTAKKTAHGYIPMLNLRGPRGQMQGCIAPRGNEKIFRTFQTEAAAISDAYCIALRVALRNPNAKVR